MTTLKVEKWNCKEIWKGRLEVHIVQMQFGTNQKLLEVIQRYAYEENWC